LRNSSFSDTRTSFIRIKAYEQKVDLKTVCSIINDDEMIK